MEPAGPPNKPNSGVPVGHVGDASAAAATKPTNPARKRYSDRPSPCVWAVLMGVHIRPDDDARRAFETRMLQQVVARLNF